MKLSTKLQENFKENGQFYTLQKLSPYTIDVYLFTQKPDTTERNIFRKLKVKSSETSPLWNQKMFFKDAPRRKNKKLATKQKNSLNPDLVTMRMQQKTNSNFSSSLAASFKRGALHFDMLFNTLTNKYDIHSLILTEKQFHLIPED